MFAPLHWLVTSCIFGRSSNWGKINAAYQAYRFMPKCDMNGAKKN